MTPGERVTVHLPFAGLTGENVEGTYAGVVTTTRSRVNFAEWAGTFPTSWVKPIVPPCPFGARDVILDKSGWAWQSQWCGEDRTELRWFCVTLGVFDGLYWPEIVEHGPFKRLVTLDYLKNS